jgi:GAF domain-containing protein
MSATLDSTLADPQQIIADLQRQLAECGAERDEALGERDKAQRRLAERTAERDEALAQQAAIAEVLQVINSSPGDLAPVFDAILEKAHSLCDSGHGTLFLRDGSHFRPAAMHGVPEPIAARLRGGLDGNAPLFRPLLGGERFVHIVDMTRLNQGMADLVREAGVRVLLSVPLRKGDALFGAIVAARLEAVPFTAEQIALLQNFAAQAVIAMENARLLTEMREALAQQTATAEVLQVINSSPSDLVPVFDAILDKARILCGAVFGALFLCKEEHFHAVAVRGGTKAWRERIQLGFPGPETPVSAPLLAGQHFVHIVDAAELDHPMARAAVEAVGTRTLLSVLLRKSEALFGMIVAARPEVRPFTDKQIALLQNFAAQAVIAMENARLLSETREALEQQTATAEVLQVINSSPGDLAPVFDAILEKALLLCDAANGQLYVYDGELLHPRAIRGEEHLTDWLRRRGPIRPGSGGPSPIGQVFDGKAFVHVIDAREIEAYRLRPGHRELVDTGGIRTGLIVALRKDDAFLGVFAVFRKEVRPFTDKQIALLQNFAAQAVIAMENARLLTETREALEQQTAAAEVFGVINSSRGDLAPVFDGILEKAHRLCGAEHGNLHLYDGEFLRAVAVRGQTPELANVLPCASRGSPTPTTSMRRL